MNSSRPTKQK